MDEPRRLGPDDAAALTALFDDYDWWASRSEADVRRALVGSDLAMGVERNGTLVAAARVLTDFTFIATIYDVIVATDHRRTGLGTVLLETIIEHEDLAGVRYISVTCRRGLHDFYASVGFREVGPTIDSPDGPQELIRMTVDRPA